MEALSATIFLLFFITQLNSLSLSKQTNPGSLVIGLSHSGTFTTPNNSPSMAKKLSEFSDVIFPLREIRDGYLLSLALGTPPQVIQVYMDTGSDLAWVPCSNVSFDCIDCDDQYYRANRLTAAFSPSYSSSLIRVLCISPFCTEIHTSDAYYDTCTMAGCSLSALLRSACSRPCPSFAYTYGKGVVTGLLSKDVLRISGSSPNGSIEVPKFRFGCVGSTYKEPIGIAGFGRGLLALPSQLGFLQKGFSYCFLSFRFSSNPNISSPLIIGDLAITSIEDSSLFSPLLSNPMYPNYYYIGLEAVTMGNLTSNEVPMNLKGFDANGDGGMMVDSGTTYTHLPEPVYSKLLSEIESIVAYPRAYEHERQTGFDLCYEIPCLDNTCNEDDSPLPSITFHFLKNVSLVLPEGNNFYAVGAPRNSTIVKCLLYQGMDDGDHGPAAILGSFQQQNVEVVYDIQGERIGFKPMDCAAAAASQGLQREK